MNELTIRPMNEVQIDKVRMLEEAMNEMPQVHVRIEQVLHAGVYARTAYIPKGVLITGALIKRATILIVEGDGLMYTGTETVGLSGYNVISASEYRKQAFLANSDLNLTMLFATSAKTVEEAEEEFTDESHSLQSRK